MWDSGTTVVCDFSLLQVAVVTAAVQRPSLLPAGEVMVDLGLPSNLLATALVYSKLKYTFYVWITSH